MAEDCWAAEVDLQERQITGQVSDSSMPNISYQRSDICGKFSSLAPAVVLVQLSFALQAVLDQEIVYYVS